MSSKRRRFPPAFAIVLAAAAATPALAGKIDVNATVLDAINANFDARAAVFRAMGVTDMSWRLRSAKVPGLKTSAITLQMPEYKYEYITSSEIVNCAPTSTTRQVTLGDEVTNSVTVTKSDTLEVGAELSVSADVMGVSASATAHTNYSMTSENSQSTSKTQRVEDSITVSFDQTGGRLSVLQAKKTQGTGIPWTATFAPADDDAIAFTAAPTVGVASACFYEHRDYGGRYTCWGVGSNPSIGNFNDIISSIKILNGAVVTVYQHPGYAGKSRVITTSQAYLGDEWNDIISSIRITAPEKTASVKFRDIKNALPVAARAFTVHGTMDLSQTSFQDKRVVNYVLSDAQVQDVCSTPPASAAAPTRTAAGLARTEARPAPAGLVIRKLSKSEYERKLASARPSK